MIIKLAHNFAHATTTACIKYVFQTCLVIHFTNSLWVNYVNLIKVSLVLTWMTMILSVHNAVQVTSAQLCWHVQATLWPDCISRIDITSEKNSTKFQNQLIINHLWNNVPRTILLLCTLFIETGHVFLSTCTTGPHLFWTWLCVTNVPLYSYHIWHQYYSHVFAITWSNIT